MILKVCDSIFNVTASMYPTYSGASSVYTYRSQGTVPDSLALVSSVAGQLLEATASTAAQVSGQVLARLVEQFDLDYGFLRHTDHDIGASVLVAEWPPRSNVPDRLRPPFPDQGPRGGRLQRLPTCPEPPSPPPSWYRRGRPLH